MIYFDTDVLVHFVVYQDENKHFASQEMVFEAVKKGEFCISFLTLQELVFVLEKLRVAHDTINKNYNFFKKYAIVGIDDKVFERAYELSSKLGLKNINDCIHTAISEKYCKNLITYNKSDFNKIKQFSNGTITVL